MVSTASHNPDCASCYPSTGTIWPAREHCEPSQLPNFGKLHQPCSSAEVYPATAARDRQIGKPQGWRYVFGGFSLWSSFANQNVTNAQAKLLCSLESTHGRKITEINNNKTATQQARGTPLNLELPRKSCPLGQRQSWGHTAIFEHMADTGKRFTACLVHNPASSPPAISSVILQGPCKNSVYLISHHPGYLL